MPTPSEQPAKRMIPSGSSFGQGVSEYALIAGTILVVSIPVMFLLGGNLNTLFSHMFSGNQAQSIQASAGYAPRQSITAQSSYLIGTGYYTTMQDPHTGKMVLVQADPLTISVAGSNGNLNTLGTLLLAKKLSKLADAQTDPVTKNYYGQLAQLAYYMGGAEGELDDLPGLGIKDGSHYRNGDALQDVYNFQQSLLQLMQNPPPGLNKQELGQVLPLATEVFNIGHMYVNNLSHFMDDNGQVVRSYSVNGWGSGTGEPGSGLVSASQTKAEGPPLGQSYKNLVSYKTLKQESDRLLDEYKITSEPVKITLQDAREIDTHSTEAKESHKSTHP